MKTAPTPDTSQLLETILRRISGSRHCRPDPSQGTWHDLRRLDASTAKLGQWKLFCLLLLCTCKLHLRSTRPDTSGAVSKRLPHRTTPYKTTRSCITTHHTRNGSSSPERARHQQFGSNSDDIQSLCNLCQPHFLWRLLQGPQMVPCRQQQCHQPTDITTATARQHGACDQLQLSSILRVAGSMHGAPWI